MVQMRMLPLQPRLWRRAQRAALAVTLLPLHPTHRLQWWQLYSSSWLALLPLPLPLQTRLVATLEREGSV